MRYLRQHLLCFALFTGTLLAVVAHAQTPAQEKPPQFRVVSMSGVLTFFFDADKKKEELTPGVGSFSPAYPAPLNREILFYREVPNADPTKPPTKVPVTKTKLPAQKPGPFLIVLAPKAGAAEQEFDALVIDNSLDAHPANTYRAFNFSRRRLAVNIADSKLVLSPGERGVAPYPNAPKCWLQVAADEPPTGWLLVSSSPHPQAVNSRTTVFLVDMPSSPLDPAPKGIVIRRINEPIPPASSGTAVAATAQRVR